LDGISWKVADSIALKLNPDLLVSIERTRCFLETYLRDLGESEGHTWLVYDDLITAVKENIIECSDIIEQILQEELEDSKFLYIENEKIGLKYYHDVEMEIWNILNNIANSEPLIVSDEDIEKGIAYSEQDQGFNFTEEQRDILYKSVKSNCTILQGNAGSGKTSLLRGMMNIYQTSGYMIGACSLSSKAARRIEEATGFSASTIHRLLACKGLNNFEYNRNNPLPHSVIVLDEFSMLGSALFYRLISAMQEGAKLIVCGDIAQLASLGWGSPFVDIVNSNFEAFRLTKILRQAEKSAIITCGNQMRIGIDPLGGRFQLKTILGEQEDFFVMFRDSREKLRDIAVKTFIKSATDYGLDECYIITTRRNKATNSAEEINKIVQDLLLDDTLPFVNFGEKRFKLGARVLAIKNNYEKGSMNGMIGYVTQVLDMKGGQDGGSGLVVDFQDVQVEYTKAELKELDLGYALTTHKMQGSESKIIIGIIDNSGFMLLNRGMIYTMITRARTKMLLLAEPYAYEMCLKNDYTSRKNTWSKFFERFVNIES
jgi:RecD/TraA family predicted helicase